MKLKQRNAKVLDWGQAPASRGHYVKREKPQLGLGPPPRPFSVLYSVAGPTNKRHRWAPGQQKGGGGHWQRNRSPAVESVLRARRRRENFLRPRQPEQCTQAPCRRPTPGSNSWNGRNGLADKAGRTEIGWRGQAAILDVSLRCSLSCPSQLRSHSSLHRTARLPDKMLATSSKKIMTDAGQLCNGLCPAHAR